MNSAIVREIASNEVIDIDKMFKMANEIGITEIQGLKSPDEYNDLVHSSGGSLEINLSITLDFKFSFIYSEWLRSKGY